MIAQIISIDKKTNKYQTITKMTEVISNSIYNEIQNQTFNKKVFKIHQEELSRISLFEILFPYELNSINQKSFDEIMDLLKEKIPSVKIIKF